MQQLDTEQIQFQQKDNTDTDLKSKSQFYERKIKCLKIVIVGILFIFLAFFIATIVLGAQKDYWTRPEYINYDYDIWIQKKPKSSKSAWPPGRLASSITAINSHQLLLYGGLYGQPGQGKHNNYNDTWIFDQNDGEWTNITGQCKGDYPTFGRFHHSVTKISDEEVLIFGGWEWFFLHPLHDANNDLYKFNFKTKVWTIINASGTIPPQRGAHSAIFYKEKLYIFGGARKINIDSSLKNDMYVYDIATNKWAEIISATVPSPRLGFDMALVDKDFYMFGGTCSNSTSAPYYDNGQCNDLWKFDTDSLNWIQLNQTGNVPSPRRAYNAQSSINNHMFLFGGIYIGTPATQQTLYNEIYAYEFVNSTWYQLHPDWPPNNRTGPKPIFGHAITAFKGHLVSFGGRVGSSANNGSNEMWEFIPPKGTLNQPA